MCVQVSGVRGDGIGLYFVFGEVSVVLVLWFIGLFDDLRLSVELV